MFARETYCFQREHVCGIFRKVAVKLIADVSGEAPTCLSPKLFMVKGMEVGFSTDSKLPAHFDIAALVRPGSNHLAVRVYRWDASSYLEKRTTGISPASSAACGWSPSRRRICATGAHKVRFDAAFRDATLVARAWIAPPSGR